MPNVVRGDRMHGLITYLVGPGRANEHTEPHIVAGDDALLAWFDDNELGLQHAGSIAKHLDRPKRAHSTDVKGGHVWHCSLSLRAEEGELSDQQWQRITESFVRKMGFDDAEGTKAYARWVAVRHGLSKRGNDHVHVVVNLVREDGTRASIHGDHVRAQKACRELEREFGLEELAGPSRGRSSRGYHPAEREAEARRKARAKFEMSQRGKERLQSWSDLSRTKRDELVRLQMRDDQPRWAMARKVRACSAAAMDEAEFVRRMRRSGLLVRPRYAEGTTDVITGFSVAFKPEYGERPVWFGGGRLAKDLTLPRLRESWPDTPAGAMAAAAEWSAARRGKRPHAPGKEATEFDPALWREMSDSLADLRGRLRNVPADDRDQWAWVARKLAGTFAAWSQRVESVPGPLAATSDALARSAEVRRFLVRPRPVKSSSSLSAAALLGSATGGRNSAAAQAAMLRQLANLAKALYDMHVADKDLRRAQQIESAVRNDLVKVAATLTSEQRTSETGARGIDDRIHTSSARETSESRPHEKSRRIVPAAIAPHRSRSSVGSHSPGKDNSQGR